MKVIIQLRGEEISLQQGDALDLGNDGLIVYLSKSSSEAYRIMMRENQEKVRQAIEFTEKRIRGEINNHD